MTRPPIRVLIDEDVFKDLAEALRRRGWDAVHVVEVGPCPQRPFRQVLRRLAAKLNELQDRDFGDRLEWI